MPPSGMNGEQVQALFLTGPKELFVFVEDDHENLPEAARPELRGPLARRYARLRLADEERRPAPRKVPGRARQVYRLLLHEMKKLDPANEAGDCDVVTAKGDEVKLEGL